MSEVISFMPLRKISTSPRSLGGYWVGGGGREGGSREGGREGGRERGGRGDGERERGGREGEREGQGKMKGGDTQ